MSEKRKYALRAAEVAANTYFSDPDVLAALRENGLSVHDAADAFRAQLERRMRQFRILEQAAPCAECGFSATHPAHAQGLPPGLEMRASPDDPGAPAHPYRSPKGSA